MPSIKKVLRKMSDWTKQRKRGLGRFAPLEPWIATENAKASGEIKKAALIAVKLPSAKNLAGAVHPSDDVLHQPENSSSFDHHPKIQSVEEKTVKEKLGLQREKLEREVAELQKLLKEEEELRKVLELAQEDSMAAVGSLSFTSVSEKAKIVVFELGVVEFIIYMLEMQASALNSQLQKGRPVHEQVSQTPGQTSGITSTAESSSVTAHETPESSEPYASVTSRSLSLQRTNADVIGEFQRDDNSVCTPRSFGEDLETEKTLPDVREDQDNTPAVRDIYEVVQEAEFEPRASSVASTGESLQTTATGPGIRQDLQNMEMKDCSSACSTNRKDYSTVISDRESTTGEIDEEKSGQVPFLEKGDIKLPSQRFEVVDQPWEYPNALSEQMVSCMMDIYQQLSDLTRAGLPDSPVTALGYGTVFSSRSSLSETGILSRGPLLDRRTKAGLFDTGVDPYRGDNRLAPPELQAYRLAIEVSSLSVGKTELEFAAEALGRFKTLVEHLARVDPSRMAHTEKLAFWINVYNALMMHAYLAYGTPDTECKYILSMQKASYVVGGRSFNATTIMHSLLLCQVATYRSFMPNSRNMNRGEEQLSFGLTYKEPLTVFALSFGAWFCPAVRLYTPDTIHEQLQTALEEFVQASVGICRDNGQVMVPKLVYHYYRDVVGGTNSALFSWVSKLIPSAQLSGIMEQRKQQLRGQRNITLVVPLDFRFRYLLIWDGFQAS